MTNPTNELDSGCISVDCKRQCTGHDLSSIPNPGKSIDYSIWQNHHLLAFSMAGAISEGLRHLTCTELGVKCEQLCSSCL